MRPRRSLDLPAALGLLAILVPALVAARAPGHGADLARIRAATAGYQQLQAALDDGYGSLHECTDHNGTLGAMGQHYVAGDAVDDADFDLTRPEVLVYEPMPNGRSRLVAVEFVVFADVWARVSSDPPTLFGRELQLVSAPNRYDVPAFWQIHVWLWRNNPSGIFSDWNPKVSCHGNGDAA
jgi:hypothetical protein